MAKNELLPFADGEDANVLPTNQWEALTDILENGFQSGIAKSEQVNRVLAQGAVASYVLGQLIVDQLNKDATLNKDTLYQNLVSALQETAKDVCLPLIGGELMGDLAITNGYVIKNTVNTGWTRIYGGDDLTTGGRIQFAGKDCSGYEGQVWIVPNNGTNAPAFKLFPNGAATWNGRNIITSAGGEFTGKNTFSSERVLDSTNADGLFIVADANVSSTETGAISVFPVNHSQANRAGGFQFVASDGTNNKTLTGSYAYGLKWDDKEVERVNSSSSLYIRYESGLQICWGSFLVYNGQDTSVTFPVPFANSNYRITVSQNSSATNTTIAGLCVRGDRNTTGVNVYCTGVNSSGAFYMAVGWWK